MKPLLLRHIQVLTLMAQGLNTKKAADRIGIAPRTAEAHRLHACKILGVRNAVQAVAIAVRDGLIDIDKDVPIGIVKKGPRPKHKQDRRPQMAPKNADVAKWLQRGGRLS